MTTRNPRTPAADHPITDAHPARVGGRPKTPGTDHSTRESHHASVGAGSTFDLQALTREVIARQDSPWTLDALVEAVYAATPARSIRTAYRVALREYVRHRLADSDPRTDQVDVDTHQAHVGAGSNSGTGQMERDDQAHRAGARQNVERSWPARLRAARLLRAAGFRPRVHVGAIGWKDLMRCTSADLEFAAAECYRIGNATIAAGDRYLKLKALVDDHGVTAPDELSPDVIKEAFSV